MQSIAPMLLALFLTGSRTDGMPMTIGKIPHAADAPMVATQ